LAAALTDGGSSERVGALEIERTSPMGILGWIIVGLIAGLVARAVVPGNGPGGLILTTLLGIGGALLGGFLAVTFGFGPDAQTFDIRTILIAILGAIIILVLHGALFGKSRRWSSR
jgi:uncharacterized membrane protein YeaQ/YmgE (transglycosylase-associated protein family)